MIHLFLIVSPQLIVNVKNKGEDVEKEQIDANTTADTVSLEFLSKDGVRVTQLIDYKAVRMLEKTCSNCFGFSMENLSSK